MTRCLCHPSRCRRTQSQIARSMTSIVIRRSNRSCSGLDSADLDDGGRVVATANADILRKYPTWVVTVEGHCDERGTAEYNLALGERRATSIKTYLTSLGISPDRVRTVSYGKEFPFNPGHTEDAWAQNRRGHFVITSR